MSDTQKRPTYSPAKMASERERLVNAMSGAVGLTPSGTGFETLVTLLSSAVGSLPRASGQVVKETIRSLPNRPVTEDDVEALVWRIVGNAKSFKAGRPASPWRSQSADEWVPLEILRVIGMRGPDKAIRWSVWVRVLSGTPCPKVVKLSWSQAQCSMIARRVGFTQRFGKYPYSNPMQLVRLQLWGKISAERSESRPVFSAFECSPTLESGNREILRMRLLRDPPCPARYTYPCHVCAIGYDQCPAGTHPLSYEFSLCSKCNRTTAFDPAEDSSEACVDCLRKARRAL